MAAGKGTDYTTLLLAGGAIALVHFDILNPLLKAFGAKDSDTKKDAAALDTADAFKPNFWKQAGAKILKLTAAQKLAKVIYDAHGFFNDDEDKIQGVFRQLKTKSQVSFLADIFYQKYNKGLIDYLRSFLSNSELAVIKKIIDPLPDFKTA